MDWSSRMQAMMKQTEANLNPGATFSSTGRAVTGSGTRPTVLHVDRRNDVPVQQQIYDLENRLRLCLNELSDVRVGFEKTGQESALRHLAKAKEELHREVSLLDKRSSDEIRLLGGDLKSRISETEQLVKEDRRKREDLIKRMKTRDYEYGELYEQQKETGLKLMTKIEILENDVRSRKKELSHADNERFEDIRNEVRYQGERMEETKRQIGIRMDKIADSVRLEVMNMSDMVKSLVRECWNDHIQAVYTKVNEGITSFSDTVSNQGERIKELELSFKGSELHTEAEISKLHDELRKEKASLSSYQRENIHHFETLQTQKALIKALRQTPDEISALQIDIKRIFEMIPALEATSRKHSTTLEIIKDVPQIVEEIKWETKKLHDPVARQEELCQDVIKRIKACEELSTASAETAASLKTIIKTDQETLNKNTKRILNALTKISDLEEEDGRKTASIEKVSHQLREHQNTLRGLTPHVSDLKCQIDANKLNLDPRLANSESQLSELWNQMRELQLRVNAVHVAQKAVNATAMSALESPSGMVRNQTANITTTSHTTPIDLHVSQISDISKSPDDEVRRQQEADARLFNIRKEHQELELLRQKNEQEQRRQREGELQLLKEREIAFQQKMDEERLAVERQKEESDKIEMRRRELEELKQQHQRELEERLQSEREQERERELREEQERETRRQEQELHRQQQQRQRDLVLQQEQEAEERERDKVRIIREQEEAESSAREEVAREQQRSAAEEIAKHERILSEKRIAEETEKQEQQERIALEQQQQQQQQQQAEVPAKGQTEKKLSITEVKDTILVEDFDPVQSVEEPHLKAKVESLLDNLGKGDDFEKLSAGPSEAITFSTGVSSKTSKTSKTYSKSKNSKRKSSQSSDFPLDAVIPGIGTTGGGGRLSKRPTSIMPFSSPTEKPTPAVLTTSESEIERPTLRGSTFNVNTSSEEEGPQKAPSSGGGSRVSRSSRGRSSKSDLPSLPE